MKIILQWDSSVTALPQPEQSQFEAAVTDAANFWGRTLASNLTVTINVGYGEITDGTIQQLGDGTSEGGPGIGFSYTYGQLKSALQAHALSPVQKSAFGDLPASDPYANGGGAAYFVPILQAETLGLPTYGEGASAATGSVGFGPPVYGASFDFDPTDRGVYDEADLIGIAEHEIAHALGRVSNAGLNGSTAGGEDELDLFRFRAPGQLDLNWTDQTYFSTDGGVTPIRSFDDTQSDPSDWLSTDSATAPDSFNAFYTVGQAAYVTSADLALMNTLGYQISDVRPAQALSGANLSDVLLESDAGAVVLGELAGHNLTYTALQGLGPAWSFVGAGDFTGDFQDDYLIENTSGAVVMANAASGSYVQVASLGPEWTFQAVGPFLGDGQDQFLIESTSGAIVLGQVGADNQTTFTPATALGPEWSFHGAGDFEGDGRAQFLIESTSGAVVLGQVSGADKTSFTQVTSLGPEWSFVGVGDYLGDGKDQFLIESTSGAVVVGEVSGASVAFTQVAALGKEWSFVASGDYSQTGQDSFMIENTSGALVLGTVVSGSAQYQAIGGLGSEWRFVR